jgi:N-acetylglucosamine malate deacetylase 1
MTHTSISSMLKGRVLVVAAHPDDEVLGCGGTIAALAKLKQHIEVIFMTDGVGARVESSDIDMQRRHIASELALKILGVSRVHYLKFPDNQMDKVPLLEIIQSLEEYLDEINPSIVFTHHAGDLNIDHRRVSQAVITACRPHPNQPVKILLAYEVLSSTEWQVDNKIAFAPNFFIELSDGCMENKIKALEAYSEEMRQWPHPRSIKGVKVQAEYRGMSIGVPMAEAYVLLRYLG